MNPGALAPAPSPGALAAPSTAAAATDGTRDTASGERALEAAREFEKLLIHDLLKTARRAGAALGEAPSNARATYDDMMDERMAGIVSEAGGFGLAPAIAEQLDGGAPVVPADGTGASGRPRLVSVVSDEGVRGGPTERLATVELLRLRGLVRPRDGSARVDAARAGTLAPGAAGIGAPPPARSLSPVSTVATAGDVRPLDAAHRAFIEPLLPQARVSARRLGTSPDVILAVAALESGWGERVIHAADGRSSHNLFGIKARPGERGAVSHRTTEYLGGQRLEVVADFRRFAGVGEAIDGFADFVLDNPRYAGALGHAADPPEFLRRLHTAGYATDPRYADKAIATMQRVRALQENNT